VLQRTVGSFFFAAAEQGYSTKQEQRNSHRREEKGQK
jgi:hypothetical protein